MKDTDIMKMTEAFLQAMSTTIATMVVKQMAETSETIRREEEKKKPRYYTRDEVCEMLRISKPTYHAMAGKGAFGITHAGRKVLIDADRFDRDLADGKLGKYRRTFSSAR